jgi:hypothetical protein
VHTACRLQQRPLHDYLIDALSATSRGDPAPLLAGPRQAPNALRFWYAFGWLGGHNVGAANRVVWSALRPMRSMTRVARVALPVSRNGPVRGLGGPLADHDLVANEVLAAASDASAGTRSALPVRRQAVNSRRSAPRPCTYNDW